MAHPLTAEQLDALSSSFAPDPQLWATDLTTFDSVRLPLISGRINLDGASVERTTLDATVAAVDSDGSRYVPEEWGDLLVPDDCVLTAFYGLGAGAPVKVATVYLDSTTVIGPDGTLALVGYSRATRVSQAGYPPGATSYTGNAAQAAVKVVEAALGVTVQVVNLGVTGPTVIDAEAFTGDPWDAVETLMDAAGAEAYFDVEDRLVLRPVPRAEAPVAWTLATGEGGTITRYEATVERAPNVVRMRFRDPAGQADVLGTATATGPADPAGAYGPFRLDVDRDGRVTTTQATEAAQEYLLRAGGLMRSLTIEAVPHPGIEVGDSIGVTFPNGATEVHRVTSVALPLTVGDTMQVRTRSVPW